MSSNTNHVTLTTDNFETEVLRSDRPVLVDFWAAWCGPCRVVGPIVEDLAAEFEGEAKVAKLDVDEHPEVAARYGVTSIPTLLFFRGGEVIDRLVGVTPRDVLADKLQELAAA